MFLFLPSMLHTHRNINTHTITSRLVLEFNELFSITPHHTTIHFCAMHFCYAHQFSMSHSIFHRFRFFSRWFFFYFLFTFFFSKNSNWEKTKADYLRCAFRCRIFVVAARKHLYFHSVDIRYHILCFAMDDSCCLSFFGCDKLRTLHQQIHTWHKNELLFDAMSKFYRFIFPILMRFSSRVQQFRRHLTCYCDYFQSQHNGHTN